MRVVRLLTASKLMLWLAWPGIAVASQVTLGQAMGEVTFFEWGWVFFLISLGGIASVLHRISTVADAGFKAGIPFKFDFNVKMMVVSHVVGSWMAGLISFFWAQHQLMPGFYIALFVPVMSFGSIQTIRMMQSVFFSGFKESLRKWLQNS